jgi:hypothetical protein
MISSDLCQGGPNSSVGGRNGSRSIQVPSSGWSQLTGTVEKATSRSRRWIVPFRAIYHHLITREDRRANLNRSSAEDCTAFLAMIPTTSLRRSSESSNTAIASTCTNLYSYPSLALNRLSSASWLPAPQTPRTPWASHPRSPPPQHSRRATPSPPTPPHPQCDSPLCPSSTGWNATSLPTPSLSEHPTEAVRSVPSCPSPAA